MKSIRIGNAAGFWGDQIDQPVYLTRDGQLDYLTLEYLAELTMSILAHQKSRNSDAGYVTDFPEVIKKLVPYLKEQPQLKIIKNAGGMNPSACAKMVSENLLSLGIEDCKVASVDGDHLLPDLEEHQKANESFTHFETGDDFNTVQERIVSANAYLGASGIVEALNQDARIVITGRVADAALTLAPAIYEFGWGWTDWDRLSAATVAGHIIECGAQATGGIYSDWNEEIDLANVGYPIAILEEDGSVFITKPEGTGGLVTPETVAEQIIYEIGDPTQYMTPDVVVDFSHVELEQVSPDLVKVTGAKGTPRPDAYKVSMAYQDGYFASGTLVICGRNAKKKAESAAKMIFDRMKIAGIELERTNAEYLGSGDSVPGVWPEVEEPFEIVLRISGYDSSKESVERLMKELAPLVTSGVPGVTGYTGSRVRPRRVLSYWPTLISQNRVKAKQVCKTIKEWVSE